MGALYAYLWLFYWRFCKSIRLEFHSGNENAIKDVDGDPLEAVSDEIKLFLNTIYHVSILIFFTIAVRYSFLIKVEDCKYTNILQQFLMKPLYSLYTGNMREVI